MPGVLLERMLGPAGQPSASCCQLQDGRKLRQSQRESERALGEKILEEQARRWGDLFSLSTLVLRGDLFPKKWV